jgi:hypothetical protein
LSDRTRTILERLARLRKLERRLAERVQIILWSAEGKTSVEQARKLGVDEQRVNRWRRRFAAEQERFTAASAPEIPDEDLEAVLLDVLDDKERSGVPPKFSAEQLTQIIALACKAPKDLGLPVTHWTPRELAIEAARQSIVTSISPRHIARFFGGPGSQTASFPVLAQSQSQGGRPGSPCGAREGNMRTVRAGSGAARAGRVRHLD